MFVFFLYDSKMQRYLSRQDNLQKIENGVKDKFQWWLLEEEDGNVFFFPT